MEGEAHPAFVRPRVRSRDGGASWLLEDAIAARLERGETGTLWVAGGPGAGLRTAIACLESRFEGDGRVAIDPETQIAPNSVRALPVESRLRVRFCRSGHSAPEVLELEPWTRDEQIEYLLARHPKECASVMQRFERGDSPLGLGGVPLVCAAVLDELAGDQRLADSFEALRAALARVFGGGNLARARAVAFQSLLPGFKRVGEDPEIGKLLPWSDWLRQRPVLVALAAEAVVLMLEKGQGFEGWRVPVDAELLRVIRPLFLRSPEAHEQARRLLANGDSPHQALAASLVHLEGPGAFRDVWKEVRARGPVPARLAGAHLEEAQAEGLDLSGLEGLSIVLVGARLDGSDLREAQLLRAQLGRASLRGCSMTSADLREADLDQADLRGALLAGAMLENSSLRGTALQQADLTGANLKGLDFRAVRSLAVKFARAGLASANFEGLACEAPDFSRADLDGALLSGTRFPRADFTQALLRSARLAWIDWEGANLFGADLRGASFQLGSSRSGLVFDAPAGWGTRTGFYTDEQRDLGYKMPEEVRKANLRRADLRTAKIFETDFHLVDLRDALYTPDQEKHLRDCGAILGS